MRTAETVRVLPSMSTSFSSTLPDAVPSSVADLVSATGRGASLTAVRVREREPVLVIAASAPTENASVTT